MKTKDVPVSKNIIFVPLLLATIFTLLGFGLTDLYFNRTAISKVEKNLTFLALSGAQAVDFLEGNVGLEDFDNFADAFAENSRFRITIIDLDGFVQGDSELSLEAVRQIENHADRPEILEARDSGIGVSRRYSSTLKADFFYVAVRYNSHDRKGYFRVALPLTDLEHDLMRQHLVLGGFCFITLLVGVLISLIASRYLLLLVEKGRRYLEQRVSEKTKEVHILHNLGTQLTACNSMEEAFEVIRLVTSMLLPRFAGTLALYRSSKDKLEIVEEWNGQWQGEKTYSPDQCWALRTGQPHFGDPSTGNMICNHHAGKQEEKLFCIPIIAQGEIYGVLHFSSSQETEWTPDEHQLARAVAEDASLTLANLKMRESLKEQAIRDSLTGLYNRRYLIETIEQEISRASRHGQNLGLLMIDLDHFKKFNDAHGHDTGDFILREFGRLVRMIVRHEDIACRYGGEEFTILLPETNRNETFRVAEKIRNKVREHEFVFDNHSYGPITLSVGAATFPENGKTTDHLLKLADDALYEAKQAGRDRVVLAEISERTMTKPPQMPPLQIESETSLQEKERYL